MPLIQGKSPKAFEHNVKAEAHAGKPMKQALAIAYNIKKKNAKKMSAGGEVRAIEDHVANDQEQARQAVGHEDAVALAKAIMDKHAMACGGMAGYAEGGEVEMPELSSGEQMEAMSESGDDFLADEADTDLANLHMPADEYREVDGMGDENDKKRLGRIMGMIRMRHMGK